MTFPIFHKIFINVITNNFHRSSKLIPVSSFICVAQLRSLSLKQKASITCILSDIDKMEQMNFGVCSGLLSMTTHTSILASLFIIVKPN